MKDYVNMSYKKNAPVQTSKGNTKRLIVDLAAGLVLGLAMYGCLWAYSTAIIAMG